MGGRVQVSLWSYLRVRRGARARAEKRSNGSVNEALGDCVSKVVEDKDRLNMTDLEKTTVDDIQALCDRFHEWVASVGEDPKAQPPATLGSAAFSSSTPRLSQPLLLCRRRFHRRGLQWI
jgi:hypothetical protein